MTSKDYARFYSALHRGYLSEIRHLIFNEGCEVNFQFKDTSYALHIVAEKGFVDVVKFLLTLQPAVDKKNCHGQTPLMVAMDHADVVQPLVAHGSNVNVSDPQRRTPLHLACARGSVRMVKELISAGAKVRAEDKWGRTPLHVTLLNISHNKTVTDNFLNVMKILLECKAQPDKADRQHSTPLFLAAAMGNNGVSVSKLLLQYAAYPDLPSRHKLTPLMVGVMKGYEQICQLFVSINCDVNRRNPVTGFTCLQVAVRKDFYKIAKLIVASGCKLHEERWLYEFSIGQAKRVERLRLGQRHAEENTEASSWLVQLRSVPRDLKDSSRAVLRQLLGCKLQTVMKTLYYPEPLKNYILLADLIPDSVK